MVKRLLQEGFIVKTSGLVGLADTAQATLFSKVASRFDVKKLIVDSAERVGVALQSPRTVAEIQRQTGLSYSTIRRSLVNLMQIGAAREKGEKYRLVDDDELKFFLKLLEERGNKTLAEPYAQVVYSAPDCGTEEGSTGKGCGRFAYGIFCIFKVWRRSQARVSVLRSPAKKGPLD